jgi:type IV pilus assembly protein PilC
MVSHMSEVGEKTGNLDTVLLKLSKFFDNEVSNTVATISTMIEPVILIILAMGVGIFVGAVLLPIYQLASTM